MACFVLICYSSFVANSQENYIRVSVLTCFAFDRSFVRVGTNLKGENEPRRSVGARKQRVFIPEILFLLIFVHKVGLNLISSVVDVAIEHCTIRGLH